ncbi:MAG: type II toxin-antitoxin system ParD family antitoxin [Pseudomonadota bacterium]
MATMNVSLPDPMKDWVEDRTKDGRFANSSDYVRHLIRRDQEREAAIAEMQAEIDKGLASGIAEDFDFDEFLTRKRAEFQGG